MFIIVFILIGWYNSMPDLQYRLLGKLGNPSQFGEQLTQQIQSPGLLRLRGARIGKLAAGQAATIECEVVMNHISHDEETGREVVDGYIKGSQPIQLVRITVTDRIVTLTLLD